MGRRRGRAETPTTVTTEITAVYPAAPREVRP